MLFYNWGHNKNLEKYHESYKFEVGASKDPLETIVT